MSTIETRVTQIKFDNAQFEAAIRKTLSSLEALDQKLKLAQGTKGLNDVNAAAKRVQLDHIGQSVDRIAGRFSTMSVAAIAALGTIASRATIAGAQMVKSLTISPIKQGLQEYETQLNSIQTILANTAHEGTNLQQVNAALQKLNDYSDKTIYNFSEMARNIGTFTAAGVSLDKSTQAIKGIANLAAISGSNAQQASTAMYQLSQSLAAGKVSLEDWNSVVNAGMGGKVFQDSLLETARVHGVAVDQIIKDEGSFRNSLQKGWLTSDILTETLEKFTGDLNAQQLKTMGYNEQQIAGILKMAKTAQDAATKVKTFSQLISTLQEAAGSGWAKTWSLIFGDFEEARTLFTNASNVLGGFIQANANARNKVLGDWKALGGRTVIIEAIGNAFKALLAFIKPIKDAFRDIFPAKTGQDLYNLSVAIRDFTEGLKIGTDTADKLRRTFAGVFAIFGIGFEIIKQVLSMFVGLFNAARGGEGSFLNVTASLGDFLVSLHDALVNGEGLKKFFEGLGRILVVPIRLFQRFAEIMGDLFSNLDTSGFDRIQSRLEPFGILGKVISEVWSHLAAVMERVWQAIQPLTGQLSEEIINAINALSEGMANADFSGFLDAINTGLLGGLVLIIRNFLKNGINIGGGVLESISGAFNQLTGTLTAMQNQIKANTLLKIAGAVSLLTASVVALSLIDSDRLTIALTGLTAMFIQLAAAMAILTKITAGAGLLKLPGLAVSLIALAIAIDLLTLAVAGLSQLSWEELAKGLGGVIVLLAALTAAARGLSGNAAGMVSAGAGLILLAAGIRILASAVISLSGLSWEEMAKGLIGVGALLASLAIFSQFASANAGGVLAGAGIVLLATGIKILASALMDIASMSWGELAKGLVGMAAGLTLIAAALYAIPPTSVLSAAAILIVAASLGMIADGLAEMAKMSWGEIAKSMVALGGALLIIGAAVTFMSGSIAGAAAILVVAASLKILIPVIQTLAGMSWGEIAKGLAALAAVLAVIGIAGALMAPVVPALIGLGAAIALLGVGMALAGVGMLAFSAAMTALAVSGVAGAAALVGIVTTLLGAIPKIMRLVGDMIVAFAETLQRTSPAIIKAMTVVITAMLVAINKVAPKVIDTLLRLLTLLLQTLNKYVPKLVDQGGKLIIAILNGIAARIGGIITAATNVAVAFLNGIARNQPRILQAGVNLIISFINGLARQIRASSPAMGAAGANLASAIVEGMARGLLAGGGVIAARARSIAQSALNAAKSVLGISSPSKEFEKIGKYVNQGFLKGLQGNSGDISTAFNTLGSNLKKLMKDSASHVDGLEARLHRLHTARHKDRDAIRETTKALAEARLELRRSSAAYSLLTRNLTDERDHLKRLAASYDEVGKRLDSAKQKLADAKKTRDDYKKTITDQYNDLPEIDKNTKLNTYLDNLSEQIVKTKVFASMLQKLRKLGLNDKIYQELLAKGTEAMPFVSQLLDSGKTGVKQINELSTSLDHAAGNLGNAASLALYQAAVNSAQGLVDGLKKQQAAIEKQMEHIADAMVNAIKKKLKIKSPSREFAKIGVYSAEGIADGLSRTSGVVEKSAEQVGKDAILSLRKSISGLHEIVQANIDTSPVIRPVIDLTDVKKDARALLALIPDQFAMSAGTSYSQAKSARLRFDDNISAMDPETIRKAVKDVTFIQNNNSPKALSSAEIYRNTKNQLSVAKGALKTS